MIREKHAKITNGMGVMESEPLAFDKDPSWRDVIIVSAMATIETGLGTTNVSYLLRALLIVPLVLIFPLRIDAQKKNVAKPPIKELSKLRDDFIQATKVYKASLEKLLELYERNVKKAEERLTQARDLFSQGLISRNELAESENAVAMANAQVSETRRQIGSADTQIADTLLEAQAEAQLAKTPIRKGAFVSTTAYIRYSGPANWSLADSWKIQQFFQNTFKKPLPVAVF